MNKCKNTLETEYNCYCEFLEYTTSVHDAYNECFVDLPKKELFKELDKIKKLKESALSNINDQTNKITGYNFLKAPEMLDHEMYCIFRTLMHKLHDLHYKIKITLIPFNNTESIDVMRIMYQNLLLEWRNGIYLYKAVILDCVEDLIEELKKTNKDLKDCDDEEETSNHKIKIDTIQNIIIPTFKKYEKLYQSLLNDFVMENIINF